MWDQIEKSQNETIKNGEYRKNISSNPFDNYNVRQNLLGMAIIFTAQGIPFFQSGSEFLRTKQGDYNSYKSSDIINSIKWNDKVKYIDIFKYYKGLIEIRKNLKLLRMSYHDEIQNNMNVYFPQNNDKCAVIICHLAEKYKDDTEIIIAYNASGIDNYRINDFINLNGNKTWYLLANDRYASITPLCTVNYNNLPSLRSYSILILYGEKN